MTNPLDALSHQSDLGKQSCNILIFTSAKKAKTESNSSYMKQEMNNAKCTGDRYLF